MPNQETAAQYAEHLLAELEQVNHQAKKRESGPEQPPRIKKFEEGENPKGRGKGTDEEDSKKPVCRHYLTDRGRKKGKSCKFLHQGDGEKRCWACGAKDHYANNCPRGSEESKNPRAAKISPGGKTAEKEKESKGSPFGGDRIAEGADGASVASSQGTGEDTMKGLLEEANRMLKNMNGGEEPVEKTVKLGGSEERIMNLQRQLDELRRASMKPFRISKCVKGSHRGLLDSGATHALRPKRKDEKISHFPCVTVTLAGDKEMQMRLSPTGTIVGEEFVEPIIPMGMMTKVLGCTVVWDVDERLIQTWAVCPW